MRIRTIAKNCEAKRNCLSQNELNFASSFNFLECDSFRNLNWLRVRRAKSAKILLFSDDFFGFCRAQFLFCVFLTFNLALKPELCSENWINPFQAVKFQRLRVFDGFFGFPEKQHLDFENFVGLSTISAQKKHLLWKIWLYEALFSLTLFST